MKVAWWRERSLLLRLTLWHAATVGAITLALGTVVYVVVEHRLHSIFDRDLDADLDFVEARLEPDGRRLRSSSSREVRGSGGVVRPTAWFEVWSASGDLLLRQWPARRRAMGDFLPPPRDGTLRAYTAIPPDGMPVRVLERAPVVLAGDFLLRAYRDEYALYRTLRQLLFGYLAATPIAALLSALGGFLLAKRSLAPVAAMAAQARQIGSESLDERLPVPNPHDELGRLAIAFNDTLERLERSFRALRRFTADASHELRTPLTALRTVGEVALHERSDAPALRVAVASMLEESVKLGDVLDALLTLARAEATTIPVERSPVDVGRLASEVAATLQVLAAERNQSLSVESRGPVIAFANVTLLHQVLVNLVHNAIRHGLPSTDVRVSSRRTAGHVVVDVVDTGPGIPVELRERVFERFFRVDRARSRESGGAGLGLAIARLFAEQQGGRLELVEEPAGGCRFRVTLEAVDDGDRAGAGGDDRGNEGRAGGQGRTS